MSDYGLIAELETTDEGSRELDRKIWVAFGNHLRWVTEIGGHKYERWIEADETRWKAEGTRFTASVDCALELVPEGYDLEVKRARHRRGWRASLWLPERIGQTGDAHTLAVAICIAALKVTAASRAAAPGREDEHG